ncbi:tetratricopeptide repeat protein, partial [Candidatus Poribacteria bacterium]|nr:tetratricopeptide repeat protein [Candidatus Poribacteria bacterium]
MKFFRYCWGTAFCILIAALFFGCSSPIQNAEKLAMTDPDSAIAAYKNIMQQKPNSDEAKMAHLGMADTYYKRLEDQEKGLEVYEEIAKAYPDTKYSGEAYWAIAMHYFQAKDYEKARDNFAKVTQDMPGTEKASDASLAIAKCYEELKKFDEAAKMYSEFSKTHASHRRAAQAGLDAARIYDRELNKPEMAVEEYKHVASEYALSSSGREARETLEERGVEVADVTELVEEEVP